MSGRSSQIAQNRVPYVPVCVSPGPGAGSEPPTQTTTSTQTTTKNHKRLPKQNATVRATLSPHGRMHHTVQ